MSYEKLYQMPFAKVYEALRQKLARKGIPEEELLQVVTWLTGYSASDLAALQESESSYAQFFERAPRMNPLRHKIHGKICGIEVSQIQDPLQQDIRYLDKLVDSLAKGQKGDRLFPS